MGGLLLLYSYYRNIISHEFSLKSIHWVWRFQAKKLAPGCYRGEGGHGRSTLLRSVRATGFIFGSSDGETTCRNGDGEHQELSFSMGNLSPMIIIYNSRSTFFRRQHRWSSMMRVMIGIHRMAGDTAVLTTFTWTCQAVQSWCDLCSTSQTNKPEASPFAWPA
jgi:hypothetical protein